MSSLQGITVAVSPSGINYFCSTVLAVQVAQALKGMSVPDNTIDVGNYSHAYGTQQDNYFNVKVYLSSGHLTSSFDPIFQSVTQDDDGQFTLVLEATNFQSLYNWYETYGLQSCSDGHCGSTSNYNNTYSYSCGFSKMTITVDFKFEYISASNEWDLKYISSSATTSGVSPNIPSGSVVNYEESTGCFDTQISDTTKTALDSIDFSTLISQAIKPLFVSIPASGNLTSDIIFQFPLGPSGLTFPGNSGIATGVTGTITYDSTTYAGTNPPQLSLPTMPTDKHLRYYTSDYTVNAQLWGFFQAGFLARTVVPSDIPDPTVLNTLYYKNSPLQALYEAYPYKPMTADIKALETPKVKFQQVYELTPTSMDSLKSTLPTNDYNNLLVLQNQVFVSETTFFQAVVDVLGQTEAGTYKTQIETAAKTVAAVVTHKNQVILNVIDSDTIPVITFDVNLTDTLVDLALGVANTTQTLQFSFQSVDDLTTTTFISSTITGINSGDFSYMWTSSLGPVYALTLNDMGSQGVALPRIKGFNFLYEQATITIEAGYINVLTDVQHVADSGVQYLLSKQLVDPDPSAEWQPHYTEPTRKDNPC